MTLTEQNQKLADHLWAVTGFCMAHKGKAMPWVKGDTSLLFRYVASCHYHGKLNVAYNAKEVEAVAFYWVDWKEHIEVKAAEKLPQFDWGTTHPGDALFIGDVIGKRAAVSRLYANMMQRYPHLMSVPFFTYRRGVLIELSKERLERFARKERV